jgi:hypothetical protein
MATARVVLGVLAATAATPAALGVAFGAAWYFDVEGLGGQPWQYVADRLRVYILLGAPIAAFFTLAFGAPLTHQRMTMGRAGAIRTGLTGLVTGALPFLLFDGYIIGMNMLLLASEPYTDETLIAAARWSGLGAWCGLCSSLAYWTAVVPGSEPHPSTQPQIE